MAKQTIVTLTDDLDPMIDADETIDFALDGKRFEIDLSTGHADELRGVLAPYIDAARKADSGGGHTHKPVKPGRHSADGQSRKLSRDESAAIRAWVRENGGEINDRGRVPTRFVDAYPSDTSVFKRDDKPEPALEPEPVSAGIGAGGDPFATFTEPDHSVHF